MLLGLVKKTPLSKKYLVVFFITFLLLVPIGTISHELGHLSVAKYLGYETHISYSSLAWEDDFKIDVINRYLKNQNEIENDLHFVGKNQYEKDVSIINKHDLYILCGGILQTVLFGISAFVILIYRLKLLKISTFSFLDWLLVFITMLLSRQIFNFIWGLYLGIIQENNIYFYGDEARIDKLLGFGLGTTLITLTLLSMIILLILIRLIPVKLRKEFIVSGIFGCSIGYVTWMNYLGPIILPK